MGYYEIFNLALMIIEGILKRFPSEAGDMTNEQLVNAQAAVAKLREFHGMPVTKAQVDSLRG